MNGKWKRVFLMIGHMKWVPNILFKRDPCILLTLFKSYIDNFSPYINKNKKYFSNVLTKLRWVREENKMA